MIINGHYNSFLGNSDMIIPSINTKKVKEYHSVIRSIKVSGIFGVSISAGDEDSYEIEVSENLYDKIEVNISNNNLNVGFKGNVIMNGRGVLKVKVICKDMSLFNRIDLSGQSELIVRNISNENILINVSGQARISLEGNTSHLELYASGQSNVKLNELKINLASIYISGQSCAHFETVNRILGSLSGMSSLELLNDIDTKEVIVSGMSKIG